MTDHETFLLLAAKQISEPLSTEEQARLEAHTAICPTCRSTAAAMRRDDIRLRAEVGVAAVSPRVRRRVLDEAAGRRRIDPRIVLGLAASAMISYFAKWSTLISPTAIALAFVFSALVGIFFGYYPARKAAFLDPIEALRYE